MPKKNAAAADKPRPAADSHDDRVRIEAATTVEYTQRAKDLSAALVQEFPHLSGHIETVPHQLPTWKTTLSWLCCVIPFIRIALLLVGDDILEYVPIPDGALWLEQMRASRATSLVIMVVLFGLSNFLDKSTAFEVYWNDELVFSKLETKRWCTAEEVVAPIKTKKQLQ